VPKVQEEKSKTLSHSDIICAECIKVDDPDKLALNEETSEGIEPPTNTKKIVIFKNRIDYANHIINSHPDSPRVAWAKDELAELEQIKNHPKEVTPEVLPKPKPNKPPKVNFFKRLIGAISFRKRKSKVNQ